jgi:hypothetical protein
MNTEDRVRERNGRGGILVLLTGSVALLAGCRDPDSAVPSATTYEVRGKVLLKDGKPLTRGRVVFVAQQAPVFNPYGEIGGDGTFQLSTIKPGDGAPAGEYKVRIDPAPEDVAGPRGIKQLKYPPKYTDEDVSGLQVTIKPEPNDLPAFVLK